MDWIPRLASDTKDRDHAVFIKHQDRQFAQGQDRDSQNRIAAPLGIFLILGNLANLRPLIRLVLTYDGLGYKLRDASLHSPTALCGCAALEEKLPASLIYGSKLRLTFPLVAPIGKLLGG